MWALVKREWFVFFSTPLGYLSLGFFLTLSTLFLWFLDTDFNLLNAGFADLNAFFVLAPWLFLLLVPALSMRSFAEEKRTGTLELLLTKPLSLWQILLGKYIVNLMLLLTALLPTVVYFFAIDALKLGNNPHRLGQCHLRLLRLVLCGSKFCCPWDFFSPTNQKSSHGFYVGPVALFSSILCLEKYRRTNERSRSLPLFQCCGNF